MNRAKRNLIALSVIFGANMLLVSPSMANSVSPTNQTTTNNTKVNNEVTTTENRFNNHLTGSASIGVSYGSDGTFTQLGDCRYSIPHIGGFATTTGSYGGSYDIGDRGSFSGGVYGTLPLDGKGKKLCQRKYATQDSFFALRACKDIASDVPPGYVFSAEDWVALSDLNYEYAAKYAALCNKFIASQRAVQVIQQEQEIVTETKSHPAPPRFQPRPPVQIKGTN